jgi:putative hydrolase
MKLVLDTHTHTLASGHAYSTMHEMVEAAKNANLELLAITEHGSAMPGSCSEIYFQNLRVVRRQIDGLQLMLGAELNILDYEGNIDMDECVHEGLEIGIASMHPPCIAYGNIEENTNACIGAMKNPYVSIIGHPDDSRYPVDFERLVKAARDNHVLLELNNSSLNPTGFRQNARENDITMLKLCKKYETSIIVNSDAHVADDVGNFQFARELLEFVKFPEELVANTSVNRFKEYLR